jgi:predicted secreted protein
MKRSAVLAASALLAASLGSPALAGDKAQLELLGYSADGRYFAFEEYGIQDGSGFPYSNIYVVDLPADKWVAGSPFRVRLDDDSAALAEARDTAHALAEGVFDELVLNQPATLIALNGDGEFNGDGRSLSFGAVGYGPGEVLGNQVLTLESFPADSPEPCESYSGDKALGFALSAQSDGATRELFRDNALPKSRGCPLDYRIYGVAAMPDTGNTDNAVVIVSVYPFGFEGPDRRFLAIPLGSP